MQTAIKMNDDHELVEKKLQELCKRYSDVQESHELYLTEVEDTDDFNEENEENWISEIEETFSFTERMGHSYIKQMKLDDKASLINDDDKNRDQNKVNTEHEKLNTLREFEKTELFKEVEKINKILTNMEIDDLTRKSLLKEGHVDVKKQFERCKHAQAQFLASVSSENVNKELPWTNDIHDIYSGISTKLAMHYRNDENDTKSVCDIPKIRYGLKLQPMPLPKFHGEIKEYPRFKDDFQKQVVPSVSETQQPYVLKSCLTGDALDDVKNVDHSIEEMWKRLDNKYGEPSKIIDVIMNDIKKIKPVKENENIKFIKLVDTVERSFRDLERLKLDSELSNAHSVSLIEEKLPASMKMLWAEHVTCKMGITANKFPSLLKFLVERKSIIEYALSDLRTSEQGASGNVHFTDNFDDNVKKDMSQRFQCLLHENANHNTHECDDFIKKAANERIQLVSDNNACWSCLKTGHRSAWCWYRQRCSEKGCTMYHNELLHSIQTKGTALHTNPNNNKGSCLLQLMRIPTNDDKFANVLWDGGATLSLITFRKARELGLVGKHVDLAVTKVGGKTEQINSNKYELPLKDQQNNIVNFVVYGIDKISSEVKEIDISGTVKLFNNINISDLQRPNGEIDILIGFEYAGYHPTRTQSNGHLLIMENIFGKCLSGSHNALSEQTVKFVTHAVIHHAKGINMESFFDTEGLGVVCSPKCGSCRCGKCAIGGKDFTLKEERELQLIENGLVRHPKHWEVTYPWLRKPSSLENNRCVAESMLKSTEKRLLKDTELTITYQAQIVDMIDRNVAIKLTEEQLRNYTGPLQYLSHHEVIKKDSASTPCRIVFNSSAKYKGVSLNDCWAKGPDVMNNMLGILIRFREGKYAIAGDIKKMYHSVHLSQLDQHMHRFLWRDLNLSKQMDTYIMTRVCFGDRPAGTIAAIALQKTAREYQDEYPKAVDLILNNTYVDDMIDSLHDADETSQIQQEINEILQSGGFSVKEWISNAASSSESLLTDQPVMREVSNEKCKILGMYWNSVKDQFVFKVRINFSPKRRKVRTGPDLTLEQLKMENISLTKRMILSQINGIYDPLGLLIPFTMKAKILMQGMWTTDAKDLGWDDQLPPEVCLKWKKFFTEMFDIENLCFNRCIRPSNAIGDPMLILFSDASEDAYGACAYVRWEHVDKSFSAALLCAKGRVAPIKRVTVVRLELCAAVIAKRLYVFINEECRFDFSKVVFIIDSKIVQAMIHKDSYGFKTYASVRVGEIQAATDKHDWAWTESAENIADWTTRMRLPCELGQESEWQKGPRWLSLSESEWPVCYQPVSDDLPEVRQIILNSDGGEIDSIASRIDITRYSSYMRLLRVTARVLAVFKRSPVPSLYHLADIVNLDQLNEAEKFWIKEAQSQYSDKDLKHRLQRLGAKRNDEGIIIVGRRLEPWMKDSYNSQELILLPFDYHLSYLYVMKVHNECHYGVSATVCKVRLKFWIVKLEKLARNIRFNCVTCRKNSRKCVEQIMAPLPAARLNPSPSWSHTSLDLFGPFTTRGEVQKRTRGKAFGLVLTCLVSRALHLDLIVDYSTDAFLQAFRRFMSLRGMPKCVYSDPGSQLEGASNELQKMIEGLDQTRLKEFGVTNAMDWKFTSADAPWQNGCSESLIPACKRAIHNAIGEQILTFSELLTVMYECANLGNERPVGKMDLNIDDGAYLCPNDLILGRATSQIPSGPFDGTSSLAKRFKFIQQIVDAFWTKWMRFYFPSLIIQQKWHVEHRNLCVGDIVLIQDSNALRGHWKMGRVSNVYPGPDKKVRNVEVEYKSSTEKDTSNFIKVNRPVQRLVLLLPCDNEEACATD